MPRPTKTKTAPKRGRPIELPEAWKKLAEACGGVNALATLLDVSSRTVQRWAVGDREPLRIVKRAVNDLARAKGAPPPYPGA